MWGVMRWRCGATHECAAGDGDAWGRMQHVMSDMCGIDKRARPIVPAAAVASIQVSWRHEQHPSWAAWSGRGNSLRKRRSTVDGVGCSAVKWTAPD
jgi:hypothetical protein